MTLKQAMARQESWLAQLAALSRRPGHADASSRAGLKDGNARPRWLVCANGTNCFKVKRAEWRSALKTESSGRCSGKPFAILPPGQLGGAFPPSCGRSRAVAKMAKNRLSRRRAGCRTLPGEGLSHPASSVSLWRWPGGRLGG